ncbi:DUF2911 domain-containing protein [Marinilongibacter aquaticus]|uniref:DUF2911 domain-containing protein n=1 Tax=Marinilongibacter aquaticus TaxID=2975157 RepID=UPI0021BD6A03|nr:DUF2911 domain-containing protein [Marinilongibacter aquaticus]UBM57876.1 DUF2911 domain-containing protein [Marinilongibacter aquaticus]
MKKILFALLAFGALQVSAQGIKMPAASPTQNIKQDFALSSIEINYSRPSKKGRDIFGSLVPYGSVWRTGANGPTTITFGQEVNIGGKDLKAGTYSLLTVPEKKEWEIILAKKGTSVFDYKSEDDVIRFKAEAYEIPAVIETFTILLDNQSSNSVTLELLWDNVVVDIPISVEIDAQIMGQIDEVMNKDNKPYFAAASYYYENGKDLNKAYAWAQKAAEAQPDAYWVRHLLAKVAAKTGHKTEAIAAAKASMEMAKKAGNMDYVRLNETLIKSL